MSYRRTDVRSARRWRIAAALAGLLATSGLAQAADLDNWLDPVAPPPLRWGGFVAGGQVGLSNMSSDFGNAASSLVGYALRNTKLESEFSPQNWTALPHNTTNSQQYGFFIGYNVDWGDRLVLGVDAAYNRALSLNASASDTLARRVTTSDGVVHNVTINASSALRLIDYATARARAGYMIGQFLPYAAVGAAVGRFDYLNSATVVDNWTDTAGANFTYAPGTQTEGKNGAFVAGGTVALGVDALVLPNLFVRAEWEYTLFAPIGGIRAQLNTGRVAAGVKF